MSRQIAVYIVCLVLVSAVAWLAYLIAEMRRK